MRINLNITLDVDPAEWEEAYGTTPTDLRADVKRHIAECVRHLADGAVKDVTVNNR